MNLDVVIKKVQNYTKTNPKRLSHLHECVNDILDHNIDGDFVETGVWAGGSCMFMAHVLKDRLQKRTIWMYDTYEGMTKPNDKDKKKDADSLAIEKWEVNRRCGYNEWCYVPFKVVRSNMRRTDYPLKYVKMVKGDILDTLPDKAPDKISLLRLDTDFYESTKHALEVLYPRLAIGGHLIIDDYGCWEGAKIAVDQYFKNNGLSLTHLDQIDHSCVAYKKGK
jgi:hypothetical protein